MLIVAFGDSTTAGTPLYKSPVEAPPDGEGDHTSQYAYWLIEKRPFWRVLNRGVNGERTADMLLRFERHVLERRPYVVVIIAGVNDVFAGLPVSHVTTNLRKMYDLAAEDHVAVVAGSILPFNDATKTQNARMKQVNDWIRAEARKDDNLSFVDTRRAVAVKGDIDTLASTADGRHPDVAGYKKLARAIEPMLAKVLEKSEADRRASAHAK
jgi:lysophospholipase L1-like esterase